MHPTFQPQPLLDDTGAASIATLTMTSHHGMRRDLALMERALAAEGATPAFADEWRAFCEKLHGHHTAEDAGMFPPVRAAHPALGELIDRLAAEHALIDPLLTRATSAFTAAQSGEALACVRELQTILRAHLALEEERVLPHFRSAHEFPAPANDAELAMYAHGFAWSLEGIADDVVTAIERMLPADLVQRLPAARAAFRAQHARGLGRFGPLDYASTTSMPSFLVDANDRSSATSYALRG